MLFKDLKPRKEYNISMELGWHIYLDASFTFNNQIYIKGPCKLRFCILDTTFGPFNMVKAKIIIFSKSKEKNIILNGYYLGYLDDKFDVES